MKLFIGNGTHQSIDFQYRLPRYKSYKMQTIGVGEQIAISGDLEPAEIDKIILQHAVYGMVGVKEFRNYKGYKVPYIYSVNEPIPYESLVELIVQNRVFNTELGQKLRQEAAIAVSNIIEDNTPEIPGIPRRKLTNLEMSIKEIPVKDHDGIIDEGIIVTKDRDRGAPQGPGAFQKARPLF